MRQQCGADASGPPSSCEPGSTRSEALVLELPSLSRGQAQREKSLRSARAALAQLRLVAPPRDAPRRVRAKIVNSISCGRRRSPYFNAPFVTEYWVPYIRDGTIRGTEWERQRPTPSWWQSLLTVLPLRWVIVLLLLALLLGLLAWPEYRANQALHDGLRHLNTGAYAQ